MKMNLCCVAAMSLAREKLIILLVAGFDSPYGGDCQTRPKPIPAALGAEVIR
jgi:hypothetical protein